MRVLYGFNRNRNIQKPFVIIYQKGLKVGDPIVSKSYSIIDERNVTEREEAEIVEKMSMVNRVYKFNSVNELVEAEQKNRIFTPQMAQNNLKVHEHTNPTRTKTKA